MPTKNHFLVLSTNLQRGISCPNLYPKQGYQNQYSIHETYQDSDKDHAEDVGAMTDILKNPICAQNHPRTSTSTTIHPYIQPKQSLTYEH